MIEAVLAHVRSGRRLEDMKLTCFAFAASLFAFSASQSYGAHLTFSAPVGATGSLRSTMTYSASRVSALSFCGVTLEIFLSCSLMISNGSPLTSNKNPVPFR